MADWKWVSWWLEQWQGKSPLEHLLCLAAGVMGGAVAVFVASQRFRLPKRHPDTGEWDLGSCRTLVIAGIVALAVDIAVPIGVVVGALAPSVMRQLIYRVIPAMSRAAVAAVRGMVERNVK